MAQQKKKTTTTKKKTTGSSRSSSSGKRTAKKNQKRPIRREVAGAILLVLALCLGFSYFQSGAWLLDQPAKLCRSLFGWGYYLVAPALLLGSYILLFHRGRNVASCLVGTALLPVVFGAIMHIALCKEKYVNMDGILKILWTSGNALESGGAVHGCAAAEGPLPPLAHRARARASARPRSRRQASSGTPSSKTRRTARRAGPSPAPFSPAAPA